MKTIILLVTVFTITLSNVFSQPKRIGVYKSGGELYIYKLSEIDSIIFSDNYPCPDVPTITYEGKIYNTVLIDEQCWLRENLDVGTRIEGSSNQTNNGGTNFIEKYCYGDLESNCDTYGGLYQWDEAMQYITTEGGQGICPNGWHIPTGAEWQTLYVTVNYNSNELKAIGEGSGSGAGTNGSGFSGLLAGWRDLNSNFIYIDDITFFWSSTQYNSLLAKQFSFTGFDSGFGFNDIEKQYGISIRCLKD